MKKKESAELTYPELILELEELRSMRLEHVRVIAHIVKLNAALDERSRELKMNDEISGAYVILLLAAIKRFTNALIDQPVYLATQDGEAPADVYKQLMTRITTK